MTITVTITHNGASLQVSGTYYRARDGKVSFWYELIRQDKTLEAATTTLIGQIREKTGTPFFFGEPFAQ